MLCSRPESRITNQESTIQNAQRRVGGHMTAEDGALDRSWQAGVDPVAGEKKAWDARDRRRATGLARCNGESGAALSNHDGSLHGSGGGGRNCRTDFGE